jgi:hypothetical protein
VPYRERSKQTACFSKKAKFSKKLWSRKIHRDKKNETAHSLVGIGNLPAAFFCGIDQHFPGPAEKKTPPALLKNRDTPGDTQELLSRRT